MQTIEHPASGRSRWSAWPVRFSGSPPPVKPAPLLGEHTNDVLTTGSDSTSGLGNLRGSGVVG